MDKIDSTHTEYDFVCKDLKLVRECVEGETAIKNSEQVEYYLPDPRFVESIKNHAVSWQAKREYEVYKLYAEYDNYPASTLSAWMGLMDMDKCHIENLPQELEYIEDNADGNGTPLKVIMETVASNVFQAFYHSVLVEYGQEFGQLPDEEITRAQAQQLGLKCSFKHYPRESIVDWDFASINGVTKLRYVKLKECYSDLSMDTYQRDEFTNYLVLALDENGAYYQKKYYKVGTEEETESEKVYPLANGEMLDYIPLVIFACEPVVDKLPRKLGPLFPICMKAISRFRTSADLNGALRIVGVPTVFTKGWKQGDAELFTEVNEGRSAIAFGTKTSNNLPGEVSVDVIQMSGTNQPLFEKMDRNAKEAIALGARFEMDDSATQEKTAEEIKAKNAKETAMLINVANSLQSGFEDALKIAAEFEGVSNSNPEIMLDKDFTNTKLSIEERKQIINELASGLYDRQVAIDLLVAGGVLPDEASDMIGEATEVRDDSRNPMRLEQ